MFSHPPLEQLTASSNLHCHRCCRRRQASLVVLSLSFPFDMAAASHLSGPLDQTFPSSRNPRGVSTCMTTLRLRSVTLLLIFGIFAARSELTTMVGFVGRIPETESG